jgi:protein-disulfide isomerase
MNVSQWADERLATLNPKDDWRPNADRALARLREYGRRTRRRVIRFAAGAMAATALCVALLTLSAPKACADCLNTQAVHNFKESGSPTAPVTVEIYSDYECPHCARFFLDTIPSLTEQYVRTGKVRLVHRDFPLPGHPHARLAAGYANAAGQLGYYELAVGQLFRTQQVWSGNGAIDAQLALVLPPGVMQKIRALVQQNGKPDDRVSVDMAAATANRLNETPSLLILVKGRREVVAGAPPYPILKSYLDQLLK